MSEQFWNRLQWIVGIAGFVVLICVTSFVTHLEVRDLDIWLHLRTGQHIVETGTIPQHDIYSSVLSQKPWTDHEWLFQVIVYKIFNGFGFEGLLNMQMVLVCVTMLLLFFMTYRRDRLLLANYCLLLFMLNYQTRFTLRPDLFSMLFLVLFVGILTFYLRSRWSILAAVLLQILWVNIHGYFFMGPLLILIAMAAETLKRRVPLPYTWNQVGRLTDEEYKNVVLMFGAVILASLVNPYFIKGASYPLQIFHGSATDSKVFFDYIMELKRPISGDILGDFDQNAYYKILIIISSVTLFLNRRNLDIGILVLWLFFLGFSLVAVRNTIFFCSAAFLVIMVNSMTISLREISPLHFVSKRFETFSSILARVILVIWMLNLFGDFSARGYYNHDKYEYKSEIGGVSTRYYPSKAVDFIKEHKIQGNFFNDFNSGAYLIGRAYPQVKVFIDGRTEMYGGEFFNFYKKIWLAGDEKALNEAIGRYKLTAALLNGARQDISEKLIQNFYKMKDWKLVYLDEDGMIFLKKTPQNQLVIDRFGIDFKTWKPPQTDLIRLSTRRIVPGPEVSRAKYLKAMGQYKLALQELKAAIKIAPEVAEAYEVLAEIYTRQKQWQKAFENFRLACSYRSSYYNFMGLAKAYEKIGQPKEAKKIYESLKKRFPKDKRIDQRLQKLTLKNKE